MGDAAVRVVGLTELRKALREAGDKDMAAALRDANTKVAAAVLDKARPGIAEQSSTVAASGRAVKSAVGGKVAFSSVRAGGTIFGAHHDLPRVGPSGRRYRGFNAFRAFNPEGYHVAPEAEQSIEEIADLYMDAVDTYMDRQGVPRA